MGTLCEPAIICSGTVGNTELLRVAWHPYNNFVAIVTHSRLIFLNLEDHTELTYHFLATSLDWKMDGSLLATSNYTTNEIVLHDDNGLIEKNLIGLDVEAISTKWNPSGTLIASSGSEGTVVVWNASSGQIIKHLKYPTIYSIEIIDWNTDGSFALGSEDGHIYYHDIEEENECRTIYRPKKPSTRASSEIKWNKQKNVLASISFNEVKLWKLDQKLCCQQIPNIFLNKLEWFEDELITSVMKRTITSLHVKNGEKVTHLNDDTTTAVTNYTVDPNEKLIACQITKNILYIFCLTTWKLKSIWECPKEFRLMAWNSTYKLFISEEHEDDHINYYILDGNNLLNN